MTDLTFYLSSPNSQVQAAAVAGQPVLLSYALRSDWIMQYVPSFGRVLIDSGAFSVMNSGKVIDPIAYRDWASQFEWVDAIAGLDDIGGDWRKSLRNYEVGGGFPTFHDSDPPELLDDLVAIARERGGWIGIGLVPPRRGKRRFVAETIARIPAGIHIHGWALGEYAGEKLHSVDSTKWFREAMTLRSKLNWITYAEALDLVVKRYARQARNRLPGRCIQAELFASNLAT